MKIIRHGKGTVGRVVKVGDPIKFANNLIVTPPLAPAPSPDMAPAISDAIHNDAAATAVRRKRKPK